MSDGIAELFTSNVCPTDCQKEQIRPLLRTTLEQLSFVQQKILQLQELETALEYQVHKYRCALSPVRKVSRDIVCEIGRHLAPEWSSKYALEMLSVVIPMSQTCSSWREALISINAAGCSSFTIRQADRRTLRHLPALLHWSHPLPLNFTLKSCYKECADDNAALRLLLSESPRWQDVQLRLSSPGLVEQLAKPIPFPLLTSLEVDIGDYGTHSTNFFRRAFENAPSLRYVKQRSSRTLMPFQLPWSQLAHFCCRIEVSQLPSLSVLSDASSLLKLHLSVVALKSKAPPPQEQILIPSLTDLYVSNQTDDDFWQNWLPLLRLPKLKRLKLGSMSSPVYPTMPNVGLFPGVRSLLDANESLTRLTLRFADPKVPSPIHQFFSLPSFKNVEELTISYRRWETDNCIALITSLIANNNSSPPLLPNLTSFMFFPQHRVCGSQPSDYRRIGSAFHSMVSSRRARRYGLGLEGVKELEHFAFAYIEKGIYITLDDLDRLLDLSAYRL